MVQTIDRCHVSLLKNAKALALWGEYDKGYYGILFNIKYYSSLFLDYLFIIELYFENKR